MRWPIMNLSLFVYANAVEQHANNKSNNNNNNHNNSIENNNQYNICMRIKLPLVSTYLHKFFILQIRCTCFCLAAKTFYCVVATKVKQL